MTVWWMGLIVGSLALCAGCFDWEWFFAFPRSRFWVKALGRGPTRALYVLLGGLVAGASIWRLAAA